MATSALVSKPAGIFFATDTRGEGHDTTAYTTLTLALFAHEGLTFVPLDYHSPMLLHFEEIHDGVAWSAVAIVDPDGSR